MQSVDERYMLEAIELAKKGRRTASPNPQVGAVIVCDNNIIGRGYHREPGKDHAEIAALKDAGAGAAGSILYINLEPCVHHGRTPPCADAIIRAKIKKAVIGIEDPNPLVQGKGIEKLKEAGVKVEVGICAHEAELLNESYLTFMRLRRPFVTLKLAQTLDGRIADPSGRSRWISCEEARKLVHRLRSKSDAVLVGIGTVLADDPSLDVRYVKGKNPVKIVVDSTLRMPLGSKVFKGSRLIVATAGGISKEKKDSATAKGADVWEFPSERGRVDLEALLKKLADESITSILVEGGGKIAASFLDRRLVDKVYFFIAPRIIGRGPLTVEGSEMTGCESGLANLRLDAVEVQRINDDILYIGYPLYD